MLVLSATLLSAAWLPPLHLDRRAVLSGTAAVLAPMPAMAKSKKKAEEEAVQKATAKEARQAMKEYKYAPRPVLEGNAETGYTFKEGTVSAGSTGELAGYFQEKGASIQAQAAADKARAAGLTKAEADKKAKEKLAQYEQEKAARLAEKNVMSEDAKKIKEYCAKNPDVKDSVGRYMCR